MKLYTKKLFLTFLIAGTFFSSVKATNDDSYSVVKEKVTKVVKEGGKAIIVTAAATAVAIAAVTLAVGVVRVGVKPEGRIMAGLVVVAAAITAIVVKERVKGLLVMGAVGGLLGAVGGLLGVEKVVEFLGLGYYPRVVVAVEIVGFLGLVAMIAIAVRVIVTAGAVGVTIVGKMVKGKGSDKEIIVGLAGGVITMVVTAGVVAAGVILDCLKITGTIGTVVLTAGTIATIATIATMRAVEELKRLEEQRRLEETKERASYWEYVNKENIILVISFIGNIKPILF